MNTAVSLHVSNFWVAAALLVGDQHLHAKDIMTLTFSCFRTQDATEIWRATACTESSSWYSSSFLTLMPPQHASLYLRQILFNCLGVCKKLQILNCCISPLDCVWDNCFWRVCTQLCSKSSVLPCTLMYVHYIYFCFTRKNRKYSRFLRVKQK